MTANTDGPRRREGCNIIYSVRKSAESAPGERDLAPNRREKGLFTIAVICAALSSLFGAVSFFIMKPFVDNVLNRGQRASAVPLVLEFLALTAAASIFYFIESLLTARAG